MLINKQAKKLIKMEKGMEIKKIDYDFTVCKVKDYTLVNMEDAYCFIGKTDEEKSLVCRTGNVPENVMQACQKRFFIWSVYHKWGEKDCQKMMGMRSKLLSCLQCRYKINHEYLLV